MYKGSDYIYEQRLSKDDRNNSCEYRILSNYSAKNINLRVGLALKLE